MRGLPGGMSSAMGAAVFRGEQKGLSAKRNHGRVIYGETDYKATRLRYTFSTPSTSNL